MSRIICYSFGIITLYFRTKKNNSKNVEHYLAGPIRRPSASYLGPPAVNNLSM